MAPCGLRGQVLLHAALLSLALLVALLQSGLSRKGLQFLVCRLAAEAPEARPTSQASATEAFCFVLGGLAWLFGLSWLATTATLITPISHAPIARPALRRRFSKVAWIALAMTGLLGTTFVGPPRDRQPSLWDAPGRAEKQPDDKLTKRVRAVAIGSASGILLSLVVQGVLRNPVDEPVQTTAPAQFQMTKRSQTGKPSSSFSSSSSSSDGPDLTWIGTLSTGVVIGLTVGFNVGTSQTRDPTSANVPSEKKQKEVFSAHKINAGKVAELQNSQPVK